MASKQHVAHDNSNRTKTFSGGKARVSQKISDEERLDALINIKELCKILCEFFYMNEGGVPEKINGRTTAPAKRLLFEIISRIGQYRQAKNRAGYTKRQRIILLGEDLWTIYAKCKQELLNKKQVTLKNELAMIVKVTSVDDLDEDLAVQTLLPTKEEIRDYPEPKMLAAYKSIQYFTNLTSTRNGIKDISPEAIAREFKTAGYFGHHLRDEELVCILLNAWFRIPDEESKRWLAKMQLEQKACLNYKSPFTGMDYVYDFGWRNPRESSTFLGV